MKALEQVCREHADQAIAYLLALIRDPEAAANVRLQAAREILDRGYGKPVDRTAVLQLPAGGLGDMERLSTPELMRIAAGDGVQRGQVIELTAVPTPPGEV